MPVAVGMRLRAGFAPAKNSCCRATRRQAAALPEAEAGSSMGGVETSGGSCEASGGGIVSEDTCSRKLGTPRFRLSSRAPQGTSREALSKEALLSVASSVCAAGRFGGALLKCRQLPGKVRAAPAADGSLVRYGVALRGCQRQAGCARCPSWAATAARTLPVSLLRPLSASRLGRL